MGKEILTSLSMTSGINFCKDSNKNKDQKFIEHRILKIHPWNGGRPSLNITDKINKKLHKDILFIHKTLIIRRIEAGFCEIKYFTASLAPLLREKLMSMGITQSILTSKQTHWIIMEAVLILIKIILSKSKKNPEEFTTIIIFIL